MIRASHSIGLAALVGSLGLHALGLFTVPERNVAEIEGGNAPTMAALGSSFEDMIQGTPETVEFKLQNRIEDFETSPVFAPTATEPTAVGASQPPDLEVTLNAVTPSTETPQSAPVITASKPPLASAERPNLPTIPLAATPEIVPEKPATSAAVQRTPVLTTNSVTSQTISERDDAKRATAPTPSNPTAIEASEPIRQASIAPEATQIATKPTEITEAVPEVEPDEPKVATSSRPLARPRDLETPNPKPKTAAKPQRQGNSRQNAAKGTATGTDEAEGTQQSTGTASTSAAGNAAASNYAGLVMRKLARARRPKSVGRGTAIVVFSIAPSGQISRISLAKSSGKTRLDKAALTLVKRAAPFPKPPPGAETTFNVPIEGR